MLHPKVKVIKPTSIHVTERGFLVVSTNDEKLKSILVDASDYPKMVCVLGGCESTIKPACGKHAHDIMTNDAVIPVNFRNYPELIVDILEMVSYKPLELNNIASALQKEMQ